MPKGAVLEAATDSLIGTSTGVQKSLLDAFYTKQERVTKGAGIYPHTLNKLTDNSILEALGIALFIAYNSEDPLIYGII